EVGEVRKGKRTQLPEILVVSSVDSAEIEPVGLARNQLAVGERYIPSAASASPETSSETAASPEEANRMLRRVVLGFPPASMSPTVSELAWAVQNTDPFDGTRAAGYSASTCLPRLSRGVDIWIACSRRANTSWTCGERAAASRPCPRTSFPGHWKRATRF